MTSNLKDTSKGIKYKLTIGEKHLEVTKFDKKFYTSVQINVHL